jgi:3-deoxy-alpha-D-manno-octulosonate 8-oxidase
MNTQLRKSMSKAALDTGIKLVRNVGHLNFGKGSLGELPGHVAKRRQRAAEVGGDRRVVFIVDEFFAGRPETMGRLGREDGDRTEFVATADEPTTDGIDALVARLGADGYRLPATIVALGGGITMDTAKAVANLLTNGGRAADYQGWDLVKVPAVHKIAVPTIAGTGAEGTRTCVMTNAASGLKLGMNSDYTVFDHIVLDPELTATVPRDQYFYTGMDAYIHCFESLAGAYRNAIGDAYSRETMNLCRQVFGGGDMMAAENRERLMVASYLGGCAIATSYVGLVHPFSAGLSVVLGLHHCVANCIVMRAMAEFYPAAYNEFWEMAAKQNVSVPEGIGRNLSDAQHQALFDATVIHQKPLINALGDDYRRILTPEKVADIFKRM